MSQNKVISRRGLLKSAAVLGGLGAVTGFQNCAPVKLSGAKPEASECSSKNDSPPGSLTANPDVSTIGDTPVQPVVPGSIENITAVYAEALHHSQLNNSAANSQKLLIVSIGPNPAAGQYAPIRFEASSSFLGISEILCYAPGMNEPILRRVFHAGDAIPETIFLIDAALAATEPVITIVVKSNNIGYYKKEVQLKNPVAYRDHVRPFVANTPFGSSSFERPYVAGAGLASGGQGDLGALHMPRFDISGDNIDVTLGLTTAHPRINENHYVAGCGLYDQNGHPIGPVLTIMYGNNYPDFSVAHFKNLRLAERGAQVIRTVVFDTFNGYLMGFHKLS